MNLNFKDVLSFFNNAKAKATKLSSFQESPFSETIAIDPYKTNKLGILSEAELAISRYINDIEKIFPAGLLDKLKSNADILDLLKAENLDLNTILSKITSMLPSDISLTDLLASCDLKNIFGNLGSILNVLEGLNINLNDISSGFLIDCLNNLMKLTGFNFDISSFAKFFTNKTSNASNIANNQAAFVAVTLASIKQSSLQSSNTNHIVQGIIGSNNKLNANNLGITNLTSFINNSTAKSLTSTYALLKSNPNLNNAISAYSQITGLSSSQINGVVTNDKNVLLSVKRNILNAGNSIGSDSFKTVSKCVLTNSSNATSSLFTLLTSNFNEVSSIANILNVIPLSDINRVIQILLSFTFVELFNILVLVKTLGVDGYIAAYGAGSYQELLDCITLYNIDTITELAHNLEDYGNASVDNIISLINIIGLENAHSLISQYSAQTAGAVLSAIQTLEGVASGDLSVIASSIIIAGLINYQHLIDLENSLNPTSINDLSLLINTVPLSTLTSDNLNNLNMLNSNQVSLVTQLIQDRDISYQLDSLEIHGIFRDFAIIQAAEIYAQTGRYQQLFSLFNIYGEMFTDYYRKYLIRVFLQNFKFASDDLNIGVTNMAKFIIDEFNKFCPDWLFINKNELVYAEHLTLEHISKDSITFLMVDGRTAVTVYIKQYS